MINIRTFWTGIKRLLGGTICGLSAKEGTIVAGMFTLITSTLHIIFESGNLRFYNTVVNLTSSEAVNSAFFKTLDLYCYMSIGLISAGIIAVFVLFLSVWKELFWGVGGYIIWIFLYEIAHISLLVLSLPNSAYFPKSMYALECTGLVLRILMQTYWLFFLTRHMMELYRFNRRAEDPSKSKKKVPPKLKFGTVVEMGV
ncbi:transmembrane protein 217-like [Pristis pectinata]|uniref:transmembrane protein 217-like n=1 Tax=Pristis pectinata TaxID=685728 RepID=UPI00223D9A95|nr:transmembrane protein 217-like [Pristis pectinata]